MLFQGSHHSSAEKLKSKYLSNDRRPKRARLSKPEKKIFYIDFDGTITTDEGKTNTLKSYLGLALIKEADEELVKKFKPGMIVALHAMLKQGDEIVIVSNQIFPQVIRRFLETIFSKEEIEKIKIITAPVTYLIDKREELSMPLFEEVDPEISERLNQAYFSVEDAQYIIDVIKPCLDSNHCDIARWNKADAILQDLPEQAKAGADLSPENIAYYDDDQSNISKVRNELYDYFNPTNTPIFACQKHYMNQEKGKEEWIESNSHVFHMFERMGKLKLIDLKACIENLDDSDFKELLQEMVKQEVYELQGKNAEGMSEPFFIDGIVYQVSDSIEAFDDGEFDIVFDSGRTVTIKLTKDDEIKITADTAATNSFGYS